MSKQKVKVKRALLSVWDKTGIVDFARELCNFNVHLIASAGTAQLLADAGLSVQRTAEITGTDALLGGRIKTIHPNIFAGILARRDDESHIEELSSKHIEPIDLVVCNLYPFRETTRNPATSLEHALEMIDIGGLSLIRAAAKNFPYVAVVTAPQQYETICSEMVQQSGSLSRSTRLLLAVHAFEMTRNYDSFIVDFLRSHVVYS